MHRPIQDGLEDYLGGRAGTAKLQKFHEHLAACEECRVMVEAFSAQSLLVRTLRAPEQVDPAPGFYARVIERIEAQRGNSFWSVFLEPLMARRIVFGSLCLLVLLASAVVSTGPIERQAPSVNPITMMTDETMPAADGSDIHRDRTVVLTTLTSFRSSDTDGSLQSSSD